ncbi:hypothetical protein SE91_02270 [Bradyrhizobium sp. DOA1]|nr:hypothetical protein SE91_02270 [Bradyrhizobium sp. DOA1]
MQSFSDPRSDFFCSWIIQSLKFIQISMIKSNHQFDKGLLRVRTIDDDSGDRVHVSIKLHPESIGARACGCTYVWPAHWEGSGLPRT